ncbi:MAG: hypothetical protein BWX50_00963 [Euryarchaeota archaeon ADurb.Bin009]|nr:MAG: hypothetical protein BWX50_00963 [Euryarchaeota archaeon ADurb.Bin009]
MAANSSSVGMIEKTRSIASDMASASTMANPRAAMPPSALPLMISSR